MERWGTEAGADGGTRWWQMPGSQATGDPILALSPTLGELVKPPDAPLSHRGVGVTTT